VQRPAPSQTPRYERKREEILDAAAALFNARGLSGTTIADVAQAVGLTTTSVTYYYRKKEDLAAACVVRATDAMEQLLTQAEAEATPQQRLTRFISLYFALLADIDEKRLPPFINFWDLRAMQGVRGEAAVAAFVALFRRFRLLFSGDSAVAGVGAAFSRAEQNARAHLVFSAVLWGKEWVGRFEPEDYPRAADRFADVLIGGLAGAGSSWAPPKLVLTQPRAGGAEVSPEAFLRAATELVNEQGYRGASVDRISARLRVTKGSFYHHNETKDDLVAQCFQRTFEVIRLAHRLALPAGEDGWSRLCALAAALVRHQLSEHGPLLRYSALSATPQAMRPGLLADFDRLAQRTTGLIADGIADGSIRPVDPAIAAEVITGMVNAAAELSKWSPTVTEATAAELFVQPAVMGLFCAGAD
jgi:AcrR family transcriptional regulator